MVPGMIIRKSERKVMTSTVVKHHCSSNIGQHGHKVIWPLLKREQVASKQKGHFSV